MADTFTHKKERKIKQTLYSIGYEYLCNNFHKFNEANKIKIALSVLGIFNKDDSKTKQGDTYITVKLSGNEVRETGDIIRFDAEAIGSVPPPNE